MKFLEFLFRIKNGFINLINPTKLEKELKVEVQGHLNQQAENQIQNGATQREARSTSVRQFGHVDSVMEECRDTWGTRLVQDLFRDLRHTYRGLLKQKGFSSTVIATIALCIGVNATVFAVLHDQVLRPLPFRDAERLVHIFNLKLDANYTTSVGGWRQHNDFTTHADLFEGFFLFQPAEGVVDGGKWDGLRATEDMFSLLRVNPVAGRFFTSAEMVSGADQVIVLSQTLWESHYGSDPAVIGQDVQFLNESPRRIVGVAPRSMESFNARVRFIIPRAVGLNARSRTDPARRYDWTQTEFWGRMKPNVSQPQALAQLNALEYRAIKDLPHHERRITEGEASVLIEFRDFVSFANGIWLLEGGAVLVLLIGGVNVVNLMLGRVRNRLHELSVRHSFGAGYGNLRRLMLMESFVLAILGAAIGTALAGVGLALINHYLGVLSPTEGQILLKPTTYMTVLGMTGVVAFLMGLLPLELLWRSGEVQKMESTQRSVSASGNARRLSSALVIAQVSFTLTLLVGAGLLFRSFQNVLAVNPGFDATRVVTGRLDLRPSYDFTEPYQWAQERRRILDAIESIPSVENVASHWVNHPLVGVSTPSSPLTIRDTAFEQRDDAPAVMGKLVSHNFFQTMGIRLIAGRSFEPADQEPAVPNQIGTKVTYVVDEVFAERYLGGTDGVGALVRRGPHQDWSPIVGIVARVNLQGLAERDGLPVIYTCTGRWSYMDRFTLIVRTQRPADQVIREMRAKIHGINPTLHLWDAKSLETQLQALHLDRQGMTLLIGIFAGVALLLSTIGIYGVLSYDVQQRRREFGIRTAIGATPRQVLSEVLNQGAKKAGLGLGLGLLGAFTLSRYLESRLFDLSAFDAQTYAFALTALFVIALIASYLPARRATKVDPVVALRSE